MEKEWPAIKAMLPTLFIHPLFIESTLFGTQRAKKQCSKYVERV